MKVRGLGDNSSVPGKESIAGLDFFQRGSDQSGGHYQDAKFTGEKIQSEHGAELTKILLERDLVKYEELEDGQEDTEKDSDD